ncbi:MAG TPA: hypothetical protein VET65_10020 [Candidatus Limnocylindrales bacterium]|nr:hypothetical protein [Candidatus Limnocylindrales bacterium]
MIDCLLPRPFDDDVFVGHACSEQTVTWGHARRIREQVITPDAERRRLLDAASRVAPWRRWGPYVSERAWGTVREDYSNDGTAWEYFPHDHARSRAYRWSEDGLGGICDDRQIICLAFGFWNGVDPILKERLFGLTGNEGNHGEDVKEYWWYLDSTPTHSWMRWRYFYPQAPFPYTQLVAENRRRGRLDPEYELLDTGVFDNDAYWDITIDYAKAAPDDLCLRLVIRNAGAQRQTLQVLPTLWYRNTWSWGYDDRRPMLKAGDRSIIGTHRVMREIQLRGDGEFDILFCENESNAERLWNVPNRSPYPKDGIHDHVVFGRPSVNPGQIGTKAAFRYRLTVEAGQTAQIRLRLKEGAMENPFGEEFERVMRQAEHEADVFYATLTPPDATAEEAAIMRQAFAGMLWSKEYYHYEVARWLDGDPAGPEPPPGHRFGRNSGWRHLDNRDVISMPDKWEYPWYAAWDLAFHCVTLAHVDPEFAKNQLVLLCREWYMHPNGQLPAYEWSFSDVNPPVHAWAALRVFEIDGSRDYEFLERVFHKLLLNFTWWVNRKDSEGSNIFEGGFLGLDNIGPFDRSAALPVAGHLEQSDATAWMAMYCLNLLEIALLLADHDTTYEDIATKFFEHFTHIASAMNDQGLWNEDDGFYYDVLHLSDGSRVPLRGRSAIGLIPLNAVTTLGPDTLTRLKDFGRRTRWFTENKPEAAEVVEHITQPGVAGWYLLSIAGPDRLRRILRTALDPQEFLSPFGLRSLSRSLKDHPLDLDLPDGSMRVLDYEPGESSSGVFGGNSNWRGPVWFPLNYLFIEALRRYHRYLGDTFRIEHPVGSGRQCTLLEVADDLSRRLVGLFRDGPDGRRPVFGRAEKFQRDGTWHALLLFHEYFHGEHGAGLGASHQTGWTGLVADIIASRTHTPPPRPSPARGAGD